MFAKDKHDGKLVSSFLETMGDIQTTDVSGAAALILGTKDPNEQVKRERRKDVTARSKSRAVGVSGVEERAGSRSVI